VVTLTDSEADTSTVGGLRDIVAAAERRAGAKQTRPIDLPADADVLAGRLVALAVSSAGLLAALTARVLPVPALPGGAAAAVTVPDYQPRIRRALEHRLGTPAADTVLAVTGAALYTATQAWASLAVDTVLHLAKAAESHAAQRVWETHEPTLAAAAHCTHSVTATRAAPLPPGPVERHGDRSAAAQLLGAAAVGLATRNPNAAATAALVAAPKATRTAREAFAATLARGLCEQHGALPLRPEVFRRLDRVDAVLIDPRALDIDALRIARITGAPEADLTVIWRWADAQLAAGLLRSGRNQLAGGWPGNGHGATELEVLVRHAHHPLAGAVVAEARSAGAIVVSLDIDDLDDLRPAFDELAPLTGRPFDAALAAAVDQMQRDGRTVAVLSAAAPEALARADVGIGVLTPTDPPPWYAHVLVEDLTGAWRLLHALPGARRASRRGVELSTAASLLGALLMVPGVRGRGPGPVTAGAAVGLWTGYSLARRALRAPAPAPVAGYDWHAMTVAQVRALLPAPSTDPAPAARSLVPAVVRDAAHAVTEFAATLRDELSDPLTPILATGSAASAVLGSPVDAVLVGSVLTFNSALAATQQVRAQRLLRRLLAVQVPPARRVRPDGTIVDTDAALLRPGDLIDIRSGDVVPADARLIDASDLEVDEATLTGESFPAAKQSEPTPGAPLAERSCLTFAGTTVVAGHGTGVVIAVGAHTAQARAAELPHTRRGPIGLQTQLREMTDRAWPVSLAGGGLVSALGLLRGAGLRQAVASGVAVSVAAVPEGLPLVATLAQQASARRLTRLGALVRTPRAIEALGRVDVVCFDKTGTLSENRLRVTATHPAAGVTREQLLAAAAAATAPPDEAGHYIHATDAAIADAGTALTTDTAETLAHLPFRSGRPLSATVNPIQLSVKGAPETVLPACTGSTAAAHNTVREMAAAGLRVIAVAERNLTENQSRQAAADPDILAELCRGELRLLGLLGLADTARPQAPAVLTALAAQQIGVRLITGDHPVTAAAIASELGVATHPDDVVTGPAWEALSRHEQEQAVAQRVVFARMSPENKVQVVHTLQRTGRVCAMVGDGANDAAAIRAASVGIGVAAHGSDPARTAADVMLLDGHIDALLDALEEGRKLWLRVQSAVAVLLGGNAGEVGFAILGSAITGRAPLNTRQLLLVNMLTDALPAAALAVSEPRGRAQASGRGPDEALLWRTVGVRGATTAAGASLAWGLASVTGRPRRASTVALVALVGTQLGQTLLDSHSPLVVGTAVGSLGTLGVLISTPGLSQLLGSTPLGPLGWAQALGSATAATAAAGLTSRLLAQRRVPERGPSPISTTPARHNTAYNSHNGTANARATTSVNGSEPTAAPPLVTSPSVTPT